MALQEVTGSTPEQLRKKRAEYENSKFYQRAGLPFEAVFCLSTIGKQPRKCTKHTLKTDGNGRSPRCRYHFPFDGNEEDLGEFRYDPTVAVTHGMYAEDDTLRQDLTDREQELIDEVLGWAEAYGWPPEDDDPAAYNSLERLALQMVRERRASIEILTDGEIEKKKIVTDDGIEKIEDPHKLGEPLRFLQKEIQSLMDDLGLTPKTRSRMGKNDAKASAAEQIAEVASDAIDEDGNEYDPTEFDN